MNLDHVSQHEIVYPVVELGAYAYFGCSVDIGSARLGTRKGSLELTSAIEVDITEDTCQRPPTRTT